MAWVFAVTMLKLTRSLLTRLSRDSMEAFSGIDSVAASSFGCTLVNGGGGGTLWLTLFGGGGCILPDELLVRVEGEVEGELEGRTGGGSFGGGFVTTKAEFEDEARKFVPDICGSCGAVMRVWELNCNVASEIDDEPGTSICNEEDVVTGSVLDCAFDSQ